VSAAAAPALAAPIPATFAISLYAAPAATSTTAAAVTEAWLLLCARFGDHARLARKEAGRGFGPYQLLDGETRANDNVLALTLAVLDLDHATFDELADVRDRLAAYGLAAAIYSSYGNAPPDDVRFRVVIPLAAPRTPLKWARDWPRINAALAGGRNDPRTKDTSHFYYLPAAPPGVAVFAELLDGGALDPDRLPEPPRPADRRNVITPIGVTPSGVLGRPTLEFLAGRVAPGDQRGRAVAAARALLSSGDSVEAATEQVWLGLSRSEQGRPDQPWTRADAEKIVTSVAASPAPARLNGNGVRAGPATAARDEQDYDFRDGFEPSARTLADEADADERIGYGWQIAALTSQVQRLQTKVRELEDERRAVNDWFACPYYSPAERIEGWGIGRLNEWQAERYDAATIAAQPDPRRRAYLEKSLVPIADESTERWTGLKGQTAADFLNKHGPGTRKHPGRGVFAVEVLSLRHQETDPETDATREWTTRHRYMPRLPLVEWLDGLRAEHPAELAGRRDKRAPKPTPPPCPCCGARERVTVQRCAGCGAELDPPLPEDDPPGSENVSDTVSPPGSGTGACANGPISTGTTGVNRAPHGFTPPLDLDGDEDLPLGGQYRAALDDEREREAAAAALWARPEPAPVPTPPRDWRDPPRVCAGCGVGLRPWETHCGTRFCRERAPPGAGP
jgi:hypothetical protein